MLHERFADWIEERRGLGLISETTARNYRDFCCGLLALHGELPICDVKPQHITSWYIARLRTCSASTVRVAHQILCGFFSWVVEQGDIPASPMLKVKPPRKEKTDRKALTDDQIRALLDYVEDKPLVGLAVRIAIATGLRRGEIAALTWGDVDLSTGKLFVTKGIVRIGGVERVSKPKTASAVRVVSLPASLLGELRAISRGPSEPILLSAQGGRPSLAHLSRSVGAAMAAVGLGDGYCLHSARHAHATTLLRKKMPVKAVSQRLGHSDVTTTLRTYAHVFEADDAELAEAMEGLLA
jgi:integrase